MAKRASGALAGPGVIPSRLPFRTRFWGTIPQLSPLKLLNLQLVQWMIDWHVSRANPADLMATPGAARLDDHTVGSMLASLNLFRAVRELVEVVCRISFGCEPGQMSYLFFIGYIAAVGGFEALVRVTLC